MFVLTRHGQSGVRVKGTIREGKADGESLVIVSTF